MTSTSHQPWRSFFQILLAALWVQLLGSPIAWGHTDQVNVESDYLAISKVPVVANASSPRLHPMSGNMQEAPLSHKQWSNYGKSRPNPFRRPIPVELKAASSSSHAKSNLDPPCPLSATIDHSSPESAITIHSPMPQANLSSGGSRVTNRTYSRHGKCGSHHGQIRNAPCGDSPPIGQISPSHVGGKPPHGQTRNALRGKGSPLGEGCGTTDQPSPCYSS